MSPSRRRARSVLRLGRGQPGLEVVEQRVVGALDLREAGDVALAQLDVAPQVGRKSAKSERLARPRQTSWPAAAGVDELGDEVGGDPARLVEVPPGDADGVGVDVGLGLGLLEQLADAIVDEALVGQAADRRALLGAPPGAGRGHHHLLVPGEEDGHALEVGDLGQARAQLGEDGEVAGHRSDSVAHGGTAGPGPAVGRIRRAARRLGLSRLSAPGRTRRARRHG